MITRRNMTIAEFWLAAIILIELCFAASTCQGDVQHRDRVVRITTVGNDGSHYKGVGTFVQWGEEPGIIITVGHLFRDASPRATVCIDQLGCVFGQLVGIDHEADLAVVKVDRLEPGSYAVAVIADQPPRVGETLQSYRYGGEQPLVCTSKLVKYVTFGGYRRSRQGLEHAVNESVPGDVLEIGSPSGEGDSGGPIINAKNELVGIIACGDARGTNGSCCTRIRALLQRLFPRLAARPPPGRKIGPPVGTVPDRPQPVLPGPAPIKRPLPAVVIPANPEVPPFLVPPVQPGAARLEDLVPVLPNCPPGGCQLPRAASPAVDPPAIETNPPAESSGGIPWATILGLAAYVGTGVVGGGLPVWAVMARRAAQLAAKQLQEARTATPANGDPPPVSTHPPPPPPPPKTPAPIVIRDDPEPSPQLVRRNREFVEVQVPEKRLRAIELAMDEYVRRYPGARSTIETIENYADQFGSGLQTP